MENSKWQMAYGIERRVWDGEQREENRRKSWIVVAKRG